MSICNCQKKNNFKYIKVDTVKESVYNDLLSIFNKIIIWQVENSRVFGFKKKKIPQTSVYFGAFLLFLT